MPDRESVKQALKHSLRNQHCGFIENVGNVYAVSEETIKDALELLKEQEAVEPKYIDGKRNHFIKCGNCNYNLLTGYMFCPHCGKVLKWE